MRTLTRSIFVVLSLMGCLLFSSFSFTPEQMKVFSTRMSMLFGDRSSDLEVFVITDWTSQASKQLEPRIEGMFPEIVKKAKIYFIDLPVPETQSFSTANLKFLIDANKDKNEYFKFRNNLFQLASKNPKANEEEIKLFVKNSGTKYEPVPQDLAEVGLGIYKSVNNNFKVTKIPTLVIYNISTNDMKKIEDLNEMTQSKILALLESMKTPTDQDSP